MRPSRFRDGPCSYADVSRVVVGALAAAWATRALYAFLFGVAPIEPGTYLAVAAVLTPIALTACWRPARRAARVDPMSMLPR